MFTFIRLIKARNSHFLAVGLIAMQYYHNKTILVTGASSGIGIAFCRQVASYGADLVITARRKDRLDALAKELRSQYDCEVSVIPADLSDPDGPASLIREVEKKNHHIDVLVNNAGFGYNGAFIDGDFEMYQHMMQVNVHSLILLTRLLVPGMVGRGQGGVLNVASMAGFLPVPYFSVYSATKQFVINFSWSLWKELEDTGVHISSLCPGPVNTQFFDVAGADIRKAAFRGLQSPEAVALKGLTGLAENIPMKFSRSLLRISYLLSKWVPVRVGMLIGGMVMRK